MSSPTPSRGVRSHPTTPPRGPRCREPGPDDRERLVSTECAAARLGLTVPAFRMWSRRRGVRPTMRVRVGRSHHSVWDLAEVLDAEARHTQGRA